MTNGFADDLLAGRIAVVTGAASGIVLATATVLARCGANVWLADRNGAAARSAACTIGADASAIELDVTDPLAIRALATRLVNETAGLDILINAAGAFERSPIGSADALLAWDRMRAVNADGVFLMCQALGPLLRSRPQSSVVNIASVQAFTAAQDATAYSVSKAMVVQLTRAFALEWASHPVRVNAVAPGDIETGMNPRLDGDAAQAALLARTPMRRMGQPLEVARTIVFLASPLASFLTGSIVGADGGFLTH